MKRSISMVRIPVLLFTCVLIGTMIGCEEAPAPMPQEAAPITKDAKGRELPKGVMAAEKTD
ncbi:MAG: hypothetical protein ACK6DC_05145 [Planctomycetota bacterium]|jgi:hypothetical protein